MKFKFNAQISTRLLPRSSLYVLFTFLFVACGEKAELDRQMEELCKKDGGIKVFETVTLPKEMFDQHNNVLMKNRKVNGQNEVVIANAYVEKHQVLILKNGDPLKGEGLLQREHLQIIREADGHVMAELVQYRRAGGDGLHIGHHTTSVCPVNSGEISPKVFARQ